jgi:FkbM family methyltransferase
MIELIPGEGDYSAFHEVFIREDYNSENLFKPHNILDIGANVGFFSLYATKRYPNARIFSFEPFPSTYLRLKEHLISNKTENIVLFPFAVSDKTGEVNFYSIGWTGANTLNSDKFDPGNCKITKVNCIAFSEIFKLTNTDKFDLAKIDCEGSEYPMLLSASDESILSIRNFIIEVHPDRSYCAEDLLLKFNRLGYKTNLKGDILTASS